MNIKNRLAAPEWKDFDNKPLMPGLILFMDGELTPGQQAQVKEAEAIGQPVIINRLVDARVYPT